MQGCRDLLAVYTVQSLDVMISQPLCKQHADARCAAAAWKSVSCAGDRHQPGTSRKLICYQLAAACQEPMLLSPFRGCICASLPQPTHSCSISSVSRLTTLQLLLYKANAGPRKALNQAH